MCVLGCMLKSHARNENECQTPCHRRSAANIEIHGFKILVNWKAIWNSWNLSWYDGTRPTCHGKNSLIWGRFGYKLLANQSFSHNKPDGFGRERSTLWDEMISVASSYFQHVSRVNIEQHECCVNFFGFYQGLVGQFYMLIEFSRHLCA